MLIFLVAVDRFFIGLSDAAVLRSLIILTYSKMVDYI